MTGETMSGPSIFGGSWINGDNAGSRYANLDNWPDNSNDNISARGRFVLRCQGIYNGVQGALATYPGVRVHDNADPSPELTFDPAPGTPLKLGVHEITCTARDASGNTEAAGAAPGAANRRTFTVDAPNLPPTVTINVAPAATSTSSTATFASVSRSSRPKE